MNVKMEKKMKCVLILLLCCHVASPVKHSLKYFFTETPGAQSIPEFVVVAFVDEVQIGDSNSVREAKPKKDWIKFFEDHPQDLEWYRFQSNEIHHFFKATIETLRQRLNQTEGVHILQRMSGCEWDDETGEINGYDQYGYGGVDFLAFDSQTLTWIAPKPQAVITKMRFDAHERRFESNKNFLGHQCPEFLKEYLRYGRSFLQTAVFPSVSLIQKTSSSPVSCHATGFYPDRAVMFWRKDGEEIHEGVDPGESLPNNDGSFQMSIDLNVSSVTPEDWQRYDCVFHLSGMNEDIVTKLDKTVIRTNRAEKPADTVTFISAAVVVLTVTIITALAFVAYKKKKGECSTSPPDDGSEQSERLNPQS
ncbi:major histocompatibility complex class I-related gene protein-like isoform X2 [Simochromis diagramma]|uniref:major histocompatibility complex class I-related gene protein-like isoform X2 n=1 Tax=Simochromis diagramma TaxID=43689 RepID=UPI001A7E5038|nr:major histocompatibility complex class I-related gene protein-like isoform X2 [Simochromis diagramma]